MDTSIQYVHWINTIFQDSFHSSGDSSISTKKRLYFKGRNGGLFAQPKIEEKRGGTKKVNTRKKKKHKKNDMNLDLSLLHSFHWNMCLRYIWIWRWARNLTSQNCNIQSTQFLYFTVILNKLILKTKYT